MLKRQVEKKREISLTGVVVMVASRLYTLSCEGGCFVVASVSTEAAAAVQQRPIYTGLRWLHVVVSHWMVGQAFWFLF